MECVSGEIKKWKGKNGVRVRVCMRWRTRGRWSL